MRYLSLLLCLILTACSQSDAGIVLLSGSTNECPNCLRCQNFEGTGYDNGETWTELGTTLPDEDSVNALRGIQSVLLTDTGTDASITNTLPSTYPALWLFFRSRWVVVTTGGYYVRLRGADTVSYGALYMALGPKWRLYHPAAGATCLGTTVLAENTTYYNWVYWNDDSGPSDGTMTMYVGTSPDRSLATQECSIVAGTGETDIASIRFEQGGDGFWTVDQILVSTSEIVNVLP